MQIMQGKKNSYQNAVLMVLKINRLHYKCKECGYESYESINELNKKFFKTYRFCNGHVNKFVLFLRKGVYHYENIDSCEKFNETSLPKKKSFLQRTK